MLSGYATRPPWEVAGVDYAVGVPAATVLKNPALISMAGVTVNTKTHTITVTQSNVTLSGYDFSLSGGWEIVIDLGVTNTTISNSNFVVGSNQKMPIYARSGSGNLTLTNNSFNGANSNSVWALVAYYGSGAITAQYNSFVNAPKLAIACGPNVTAVAEYNLFYNSGAVQFSGSTTNSVEAFNTIYESNPSGMHAIEVEADNKSTMTNTTISNNVIIAAGSSLSMSYVIAVTQQAGSTLNGALVQDNYIDFSSSYGPFYTPSGSGLVFSGNVNLKNGSVIGNPTGTSASDVVSIVASQTSGTLVPGDVITIVLNMDQPEFIIGTPKLTLNDGGAAVYVGGSGTKSLVFSYTVAATDTTVSSLAVTGVSLTSGAAVQNILGDAAALSGAAATFSGLSVDPPASTIAWAPNGGTGTEGSPINLGAIAVSLANGATLMLAGDQRPAGGHGAERWHQPFHRYLDCHLGQRRRLGPDEPEGDAGERCRLHADRDGDGPGCPGQYQHCLGQRDRHGGAAGAHGDVVVGVGNRRRRVAHCARNAGRDGEQPHR